MPKYLLIPDVHGREFWREPVEKVLSEDNETEIVFLGDYVDPYPDEGISKEHALSVFRDILLLKEENPDRITLLLGNHDLHYINPGYMGHCRFDYERCDEIKGLLTVNHDMFSLCKIVECANGKRVLLSHAGITKAWILSCEGIFGSYDIVQFDKYINPRFHENFEEEDKDLWKALSYISIYRGGQNHTGSLVWADLLEHTDVDERYQDFVQIFGHTQIKFPIHWIRDNEFYCLDCHKVFLMDENGDVDFYQKDDSSEMILLSNKKTLT